MTARIKALKRIPFACLMDFTGLMAILLKSSLSIKDAVDIAARSSERKDVRELAGRLAAGMERGSSFLGALDACGELPPVYGGLVRIGEKTGELSKSYERLSDYLSEKKRLADGLSGAMIYPILVLLVAAVGGAAVCLYTMPKLRDIFGELGGTAALELDRSLAASGRSAIALIACAACASAACISARALKRRNAAFARRLDETLYRLPFYGKIAQSRCLLDFSFAMESMVAGGVPLDEAMKESAMASSNAYFSASLVRARELARKGYSLSAACAALPAFPAYMTQWLAVGERTGKPQEIFGRLRAYYQAMAEKRAKNSMALIEPGASLLIGACVLYMIFTFVIPLFNAMGSMISVQ